MVRTTGAILMACMLASCGGDRDAVPKPEPTFASAARADDAVPDSLRADYQHMLECEMKARAAKGLEPEIDTATVVRLTKAVKAGRTAPSSC